MSLSFEALVLGTEGEEQSKLSGANVYKLARILITIVFGLSKNVHYCEFEIPGRWCLLKNTPAHSEGLITIVRHCRRVDPCHVREIG